MVLFNSDLSLKSIVSRRKTVCCTRMGGKQSFAHNFDESSNITVVLHTHRTSQVLMQYLAKVKLFIEQQEVCDWSKKAQTTNTAVIF